jgi:hypothetical protein
VITADDVSVSFNRSGKIRILRRSRFRFVGVNARDGIEAGAIELVFKLREHTLRVAHTEKVKGEKLHTLEDDLIEPVDAAFDLGNNVTGVLTFIIRDTVQCDAPGDLYATKAFTTTTTSM